MGLLMRPQRSLSRRSRIDRHRLLRGFHSSGQPNREGRAAAGLALDHDVAAHHLTEAFADGEPKPGSIVFARRRRIGLRKFLKQLVHLLRRHADARISDGDRNPIVAVFLSLPRIDRDGAALRKFIGVAHEVKHRLP